MKFLEGVATFIGTVVMFLSIHSFFGFEITVIILLCAILFKLVNK